MDTMQKLLNCEMAAEARRIEQRNAQRAMQQAADHAAAARLTNAPYDAMAAATRAAVTGKEQQS